MFELVSRRSFEDARSEITAPERNIRRMIHSILKRGKYIPPEPILPFERAIQLATVALNEAEAGHAPPDRLDLLRQWVVDVYDLQERGMEQAMREQQARQAEVQAETMSNPMAPAPMIPQAQAGPPMPPDAPPPGAAPPLPAGPEMPGPPPPMQP